MNSARRGRALAIAGLLAVAAVARAQAPVAQVDTGAVVIYRPAGADRAGPVQITVGAAALSLAAGQRLRVTLPAGFNVIGAELPGGRTAGTPVDVRAGDEHYVRVTVSPEGVLAMALVAPDEARPELAALPPDTLPAPPPPTAPGAWTPPPASGTWPPPSSPAQPPAPVVRAPRPPQPQVWPGRVMLGVQLAGAQVRLDSASPSGYHFAVDAAGIIKRASAFTLWLDGGIGYTAGTLTYSFTNHDLQLQVSLLATFEKKLKLPIVPFARVGVAADILLYQPLGVQYTGYGIGVRVGGGAYYFVTRRIGVGLETGFTVGGGGFPWGVGFCGRTPATSSGDRCAGVYATWDFGVGARFAL